MIWTNLLALLTVITHSRSVVYDLYHVDVGLFTVIALLFSYKNICGFVYYNLFGSPDITIAPEPLNPDAKRIALDVRIVFKRIFSEGGKHKVFICASPESNTKLFFNKNKDKVKVETGGGTSVYPYMTSTYVLPKFVFENSPTIFNLSNEERDGRRAGVQMIISSNGLGGALKIRVREFSKRIELLCYIVPITLIYALCGEDNAFMTLCFYLLCFVLERFKRNNFVLYIFMILLMVGLIINNILWLNY